MRVLEFKLTQAQLPTAFMDDAQPVMDTLRLYKTPGEIAYHREAIRISEAALEQVIAEVKPGMTELEIAAKLATTQIDMGGGDMPFPPIVLSGPNAALPHGVPSDRQVQKGEVLLIDFGTRHKGYISDITRTFFVGQPPDEYLRVYEAVKLANQVGRETARPGMVISEVDKTVREVIEDAGYGEYFTHRTGHGMGLDGHENPSVDKSNHNVLEPGMVFTIEPGIYIVGKVGVRIEDNVVVTKEGCESLTTFPRESRIL
jgi:Xaa-Pro dipeptidase